MTDRQRTVMLYCNSLHKGGAERVFAQLAERFADCGYRSILVTSFADVHKREPQAILMLVGVGPLQQEMAEKAVALGIADHVVMTGNRDDVPEMLAAMDVFAFPSLWEATPPRRNTPASWGPLSARC